MPRLEGPLEEAESNECAAERQPAARQQKVQLALRRQRLRKLQLER